jgi:hypothetical protein
MSAVPLLSGLLIVFIVCAIAVIVFVFRVLLPRTLSRSEGPQPNARCRECDLPVRGCQHYQGVPSQWVHAATGSQFGPDGHRAQHH